MSDVLVLNAAYQPVGLVSWRDAVTKMYSERSEDRVEVVTTYSNRVIRTATTSMPMPSVVRHIRFNKIKKNGIKFSRDNVWARDRGRCQYCGQQVPRNSYTYDHVIPKSRGGKTSWENIVTACSLCNARKSNRTPQEANMRLLSKPVKPDALPEGFRRNMTWSPAMPEEWKTFFGIEYWIGDAK